MKAKSHVEQNIYRSVTHELHFKHPSLKVINKIIKN